MQITISPREWWKYLNKQKKNEKKNIQLIDTCNLLKLKIYLKE